MIPGLQGADAGGPLVRPYSPEGSWPPSPHPGTPPVGLPQAEVPLSTVDVGDAASHQAGSDLGWTLGSSPQPRKQILISKIPNNVKAASHNPPKIKNHWFMFRKFFSFKVALSGPHYELL